MGKRGSISSFLEGKKIVIYGIGYVAQKFYHALVAQGLDSNVEYFVVSQRIGEQTAMNGINVRVIQELKAGDDTMICIAVHETGRKEIEKLLENENIKNYIWISPYDLAELFYGKPKEKAVPIPVNKIIRSCKDYRFAVKYLAIENYFGINDYGYDIYLKAQQLHCEKQTATKRLKAFLDLIDNWERFGYHPDSRILLDENYEVLDGAHRTILAEYFNVGKVNCDMFDSAQCHFDWHGSNVRLTRAKLSEGEFSGIELAAIEEVFARIQI